MTNFVLYVNKLSNSRTVVREMKYASLVSSLASVISHLELVHIKSEVIFIIST